jgi:hypothetical protein
VRWSAQPLTNPTNICSPPFLFKKALYQLLMCLGIARA